MLKKSLPILCSKLILDGPRIIGHVVFQEPLLYNFFLFFLPFGQKRALFHFLASVTHKHKLYFDTACPKSSDPFYVVNYTIQNGSLLLGNIVYKTEYFNC